MPPKNKAKGVPTSSEESAEKKKSRKAKLAEKKAAKLQAIQDRRNVLKMEQLKLEIERGTMNTERLSRTWRDMVISVKMPQIKEDLEVAWHSFDRALDIKNYSISLLLDELDDAQEQYQVNERAHLEVINRMLDTYRMRLASEDKNYQTELQEIVDVTLAETEMITLKQTDDEVFLQAIMFAMEQHLEALMKTVKGATISKVGELEDDNRNIRRVAKFLLEKRFHELWDEYVSILNKYKAETEDLRKGYDFVKEKDENARIIIAKQLTHTGNLFESIHKLKNKIENYKLAAARQISEIVSERDFFNEAYWVVKTRFVSEQRTDKEQLKIVTGEFNATMTQLKRILTKGENLLSLMQICQKYETPEEKILPLKPPAGLEEYPEELAVDFGWDRSHAAMAEFRNLELFWRRVGSVKITAKKLRLERDKLREEGRCLRRCLQRCLNERTLPLEPTSHCESSRNRRGRPVVVEASLCKF